MRAVLIIMMVLVAANVSFAADLGSSREIIKNIIPVWSGTATASGDKFLCGEDMTTPCLINALPFTATGNTCDFVNDYDEACPFSGSSSPDVVYSFTPGSDVEISVDLCANGQVTYDTKLYILDGDQNLIACNDDFYDGAPCGENVSYIGSAYLAGGTTYYIVVDGYGFDCGPYFLEVAEVAPVTPCVVESPDPDNENEPMLLDGYVDTFNSGCNVETGNPLFQQLVGHVDTGELEFFGKSGWYTTGGVEFRDTDWFTLVFKDQGMVFYEIVVEQQMTLYRLSTGDCSDLRMYAVATLHPCESNTGILYGDPGDVAWLWMGPESYTPPVGFSGNEFNYVMRYEGVYGTPVEDASWDAVKAMYR